VQVGGGVGSGQEGHARLQREKRHRLLQLPPRTGSRDFDDTSTTTTRTHLLEGRRRVAVALDEHLLLLELLRDVRRRRAAHLRACGVGVRVRECVWARMRTVPYVWSWGVSTRVRMGVCACAWARAATALRSAASSPATRPVAWRCMWGPTACYTHGERPASARAREAVLPFFGNTNESHLDPRLGEERARGQHEDDVEDSVQRVGSDLDERVRGRDVVDEAADGHL
jgi:hypothetical protein